MAQYKREPSPPSVEEVEIERNEVIEINCQKRRKSIVKKKKKHSVRKREKRKKEKPTTTSTAIHKTLLSEFGATVRISNNNNKQTETTKRMRSKSLQYSSPIANDVKLCKFRNLSLTKRRNSTN